MSRIADYDVPSLADFYTKTAIPNAPKHTGRLPLSQQETELSVPKAVLFAPEPSMQSHRVAENIFYRHEETPLNTVFFSEANLDNLQKQIHDLVFSMSGGTADIGRQSDEDLKLIMRSYYLQYAENAPGRVAEELDMLNKRVANFAANRIMVEVESYRYYRKDILDFPEPIANPVNVKKYGSQINELKSFFG
jgi:hypothetical protein